MDAVPAAARGQSATRTNSRRPGLPILMTPPVCGKPTYPANLCPFCGEVANGFSRSRIVILHNADGLRKHFLEGKVTSRRTLANIEPRGTAVRESRTKKEQEPRRSGTAKSRTSDRIEINFGHFRTTFQSQITATASQRVGRFPDGWSPTPLAVSGNGGMSRLLIWYTP